MLRRKRDTEEVKVEQTRQFVGFRIGEELYGIDIHAVQEIDRMLSITKLPQSLPFIEGVINLRGSIIPVMDMARRFGFSPVDIDRQTRIIIARLSGQTVGLIVELVTEVIQLKESDIKPAPRMAFAVDKKYVEGVGKTGEGLIIILDLRLLLSAEEMSQLQQHPLS